MTKKNKKWGLQCVEIVGDDPILGNSSLTDSDDDDAELPDIGFKFREGSWNLGQ